MNEYIKICKEALDEGIDFTMSNVHTAVARARTGLPNKLLGGEARECVYGAALDIKLKRRKNG